MYLILKKWAFSHNPDNPESDCFKCDISTTNSNILMIQPDMNLRRIRSSRNNYSKGRLFAVRPICRVGQCIWLSLFSCQPNCAWQEYTYIRDANTKDVIERIDTTPAIIYIFTVQLELTQFIEIGVLVIRQFAFNLAQEKHNGGKSIQMVYR
jgi:hypothetical protein